jgi:hypothetical protein
MPIEHRPPYVERMIVYAVRGYECGHHSSAEDAYEEVARDLWFKRKRNMRATVDDEYLNRQALVVGRLARWLAWVDGKAAAKDGAR